MFSRVATLISAITGVVGCAAAIVVVPEVRCMLGLPTDEIECVRHPRGGGLPSSASRLRPEEGNMEAAIGRIQLLYDRVEHDHQTGRYDSVRKEITGVPSDSVYATIYLSRGAVPKIRARIYRGNQRTSVLAYYDGGELAFLYSISSRLPASGEAALDEQRFYFARGKLVRWLRGTKKRKVAEGSSEYARSERAMGEFGNRLLAGARAADPVITF
jgi:hypothetical protein